jgi:hypothetical protein
MQVQERPYELGTIELPTAEWAPAQPLREMLRTAALGLARDERIVLAQTVGYPR